MRACAERLSTAARASSMVAGSCTVAVTTIPKLTSPAPPDSSDSFAKAAITSLRDRPVGFLVDPTRNSASRLSASTMAAARAGSMGR